MSACVSRLYNIDKETYSERAFAQCAEEVGFCSQNIDVDVPDVLLNLDLEVMRGWSKDVSFETVVQSSVVAKGEGHGA